MSFKPGLSVSDSNPLPIVVVPAGYESGAVNVAGALPKPAVAWLAGERVAAANPLPVRLASDTSKSFNPGLPVSEANPLPVVVVTGQYRPGVAISDENPMPVGGGVFLVGLPKAMNNPYPVRAIGLTGAEMSPHEAGFFFPLLFNDDL